MNDLGDSLVIGADGTLGRAVAERLSAHACAVVKTQRRPAFGSIALDIAAGHAWRPPTNVTTAYFLAAVTSQRECRSSYARAYSANVTGTVSIIQRLVDAGIFVVFPSTNLVFDGSQPRVSSDAPTNPKTTYGRMKAEAEAGILKLGGGVAVVRLTKVIDSHWPLFAQWRASLAQGLVVHPFEDMYFSPVPLNDAVCALITAAQKRAHGIMQVSGRDDISYAEACTVLADRYTFPASLIQPISWLNSDVPLEHVPVHTTLDTTRAEQICGFKTPDALTALKDVFAA